MTTETTRHTPGPWKVGEANAPKPSSIGVVTEKGELRIAEVHVWATMPDPWANARLIAAAPEMASELETLTEMHKGRCDSCGCEVAPEGYCGCAPGRDSVEYERRCHARALLRRLEGE